VAAGAVADEAEEADVGEKADGGEARCGGDAGGASSSIFLGQQYLPTSHQPTAIRRVQTTW